MKELIKSCIAGDVLSQKHLYDMNKGKMFGLCLRYANNREEAKDMLQEGFLRVFRDLSKYTGEGNFEGWLRRVIVHAAIDHLKKQKLKMSPLDIAEYEMKTAYEMDISLFDDTPGAMLKLMHQLPKGFRTILNLYVIEDFSHVEISQMLDISVGTSKSQLSRAKELMRKLLNEKLTR